MNRMFFQAVMGLVMLLDEKDGGDGAGGGGGNNGSKPGGAGSGGNAGGGTSDSAKQIEALTNANKALEARLAKLEGAGGGGEGDDLLNRMKANKDRESQSAGDAKALEAAIRFNLDSPGWLKNNASLLPKDVEDIFKTAEKETFGSAIEKDQAVKSAIVQSFFSVQSNLDLLTPGLKSSLEDYLKLTKTGKQEKAQAIYDSIFEPALEMMRRTKKAEALSKGYSTGSASEDQYKNKLTNISRAHYLGEKKP